MKLALVVQRNIIFILCVLLPATVSILMVNKSPLFVDIGSFLGYNYYLITSNGNFSIKRKGWIITNLALIVLLILGFAYSEVDVSVFVISLGLWIAGFNFFIFLNKRISNRITQEEKNRET
jgi:hypothetical protein